MVDLSRRQVFQAGAAGAGALMLRGGWPGAAAAEQPLPGPGTGELKLWYDEPAGTTWLRALPVGNGRLGAMVFGNVEAETLQLNEDTVWAGGPYDSANPGGAAALAEIRRLVFENRWAEAQRLVDQAMLGRPVGPARLPARRQPAAVVPRAGRRDRVPPRAGPRHGHRHRGVRRRGDPLPA